MTLVESTSVGLLSMAAMSGAFAEGESMNTRSQMQFSNDRTEALRAVGSIASGRGWCNVVPRVVDDMPDLKINFTGLWVNQGVAKASFVTASPRHDEAQSSSLGVLHSRGRLGSARISALLGGAPFTVRQDHAQRGLLLVVPADTPAALVLDVMCTTTTSLCDFELTGDWRLDLFVRQ